MNHNTSTMSHKYFCICENEQNFLQILSVLGALLMGFSKSANSFEMLVIGRFSIGLACGFFTGLAPLYVSEIAPVKIRGEIGTINQVFVCSVKKQVSCEEIIFLHKSTINNI